MSPEHERIESVESRNNDAARRSKDGERIVVLRKKFSSLQKLLRAILRSADPAKLWELILSITLSIA